MIGIDVTMIDGRPALLLLDPDAAAGLAALVHRANDQRVYAGGLPVPGADQFVRAARHMVSLAALVPSAEPLLAIVPEPGGSLIGVGQASRRLCIGERAVRKRIAAGKLRAQRVGTCWLIDEKDLCS